MRERNFSSYLNMTDVIEQIKTFPIKFSGQKPDFSALNSDSSRDEIIKALHIKITCILEELGIMYIGILELESEITILKHSRHTLLKVYTFQELSIKCYNLKLLKRSMSTIKSILYESINLWHSNKQNMFEFNLVLPVINEDMTLNECELLLQNLYPKLKLASYTNKFTHRNDIGYFECMMLTLSSKYRKLYNIYFNSIKV